MLPSLVLLGLLTGALRASQEEPRPPVEVAAIELLRGLRSPEAPPPEVSGSALAQLGPGAVDLLLTVLEERRVPGLEAQEAQVLSRPQSATVLTALTHLGRVAVLPRVMARYSPASTTSQRRTALEALGAVGEGRELDRLFEFTKDPESTTFDDALADSLQRAVQSVLVRDGRGYHELIRTWGKLCAPELEAVVLGVGATRDPRGLAFFADVYPWAAEQWDLIASQVPLVAPSNDNSLNSEMASALLDQLDSDNANSVNAAIHALGSLEDFYCVAPLIDLLDSESGARTNAHYALCKLLNKNTRASVELWRQWYRGEEQWFKQRSVRALADLEGGTEAEALAALEEVGLRRLERHSLALAVGSALEHPSEGVRVKACAILTGLSSRWAIHDLLGALHDPSAAVRQAATRALQAITGENRPGEPEAWEGLAVPRPAHY
jgi:HEAT repeat protein